MNYSKGKSGEKKTPNIEIGQLVLIKEDNCAPSTWPQGIVVNTFQGKDGLVRVVEIKDAKGHITKRPISKIVIMPILEEILVLRTKLQWLVKDSYIV